MNFENKKNKIETKIWSNEISSEEFEDSDERPIMGSKRVEVKSSNIVDSDGKPIVASKRVEVKSSNIVDSDGKPISKLVDSNKRIITDISNEMINNLDDASRQ